MRPNFNPSLLKLTNNRFLKDLCPYAEKMVPFRVTNEVQKGKFHLKVFTNTCTFFEQNQLPYL